MYCLFYNDHHLWTQIVHTPRPAAAVYLNIVWTTIKSWCMTAWWVSYEACRSRMNFKSGELFADESCRPWWDMSIKNGSPMKHVGPDATCPSIMGLRWDMSVSHDRLQMLQFPFPYLFHLFSFSFSFPFFLLLFFIFVLPRVLSSVFL